MKKITLYNDRQITEYEFSKNLYLFLKYFNMLERNIGMCIARMHEYKNPASSYELLTTLSFFAKLKKLEELVSNKKSKAEEKTINDFDDWIKKVAEIRSLRNNYVHGYWDIISNVEKPIVFNSTEWVKEENTSREQMSLDQFKVTVGKIKEVFDKFVRLKDKLERLPYS